MEPIEVRLARIEEGLTHLQSRGEERHSELKKILAPMRERLEKHHITLALLQRDKKWVFGISAAIGATVGSLTKYILHL